MCCRRRSGALRAVSSSHLASSHHAGSSTLMSEPKRGHRPTAACVTPKASPSLRPRSMRTIRAVRDFPFDLVHEFVQILGVFGRDAVRSVQPLPQIDIGAAFGTERAVGGVGVFCADRAGHQVSTGLGRGRHPTCRTRAPVARCPTPDPQIVTGRRSRLRCSSKCPSGVHPARTVSVPSRLKAARRTCSKAARSFFGIGARSRVI